MKAEAELMKPCASSSECCQVCFCPTNASSHFGAISCLACAAFFRRTVSLEIQFKCTSQQNCRIYYEQRILCKACRYERCISAGMKPQCVQKRKIIAKGSIKQESRSTTPAEIPEYVEQKSVSESFRASESTQPFGQCWSVSPQSSVSSVINDPKPSDQLSPMNYSMNKSQLRFGDIRSVDLLKHFVDEEKTTTARRKVMFSNSPLNVLNNCVGVIPFSHEDLSPFTVKSHNIHMRFDHLLSYEYCKNLPGFADLSSDDKTTVFRYVVMSFCALDIAFLTSQMKMTERGLIVYTNATYSSVLDLSTGWDNEDEITSAEKEKLILPLNRHFFFELIKPMTEINLDQTEYAALKALTLWRTCYFELSPSAKVLAKEHEYGIIRGLHEYYKGRADGPERMGAVILFIGNIFEMYQLIIESYKKIELFNLINIDMFVRELLQF